MTHVFVSYSRADAIFAKAFVEMLREDLLPEPEHFTWYDGRLRGGQDWWDEILRQIARADIFIYLMSGTSVQSEYCKAEFKEAWRLRKHVLTVQITSEIRYPDTLKRIQYVNMCSGIADGQGVRALVRALRHLEAQVPTVPPTPRSLEATPLPGLDPAHTIETEDDRETQPIKPFDYEEHDRRESERLCVRAEEHNQRGNFELAAIDAREAVRLNPKNIKAYIELGYAYDEQTEYDRAIQEFHKARELNPDSPEVYANLGVTYYNKADYLQALKNFNRAIRLSPEDPRYREWQSIVLRSLGLYTEI